eukprot:CAMPEP_0114525264 /NCGR_PEP_ID=MMETSP0109-20121206/22321_1 /TAXON_ID=29199 /ORGANISM="Chlorarachnion reptans, Strain CCCM449" /LENGTH=268 /DNA_ID=CAMNT_0001706813 /DNA_START=511 /DNA_END=1314 /DNA_ORIENTATION=+
MALTASAQAPGLVDGVHLEGGRRADRPGSDGRRGGRGRDVCAGDRADDRVPLVQLDLTRAQRRRVPEPPRADDRVRAGGALEDLARPVLRPPLFEEDPLPDGVEEQPDGGVGTGHGAGGHCDNPVEAELLRDLGRVDHPLEVDLARFRSGVPAVRRGEDHRPASAERLLQRRPRGDVPARGGDEGRLVSLELARPREGLDRDPELHQLLNAEPARPAVGTDNRDRAARGGGYGRLNPRGARARDGPPPCARPRQGPGGGQRRATGRTG